MSVVLAELKARLPVIEQVDFTASEYTTDRVFLEQGEDIIVLDHKQLQELTVAIDRFLEHQ